MDVLGSNKNKMLKPEATESYSLNGRTFVLEKLVNNKTFLDAVATRNTQLLQGHPKAFGIDRQAFTLPLTHDHQLQSFDLSSHRKSLQLPYMNFIPFQRELILAINGQTEKRGAGRNNMGNLFQK